MAENENGRKAEELAEKIFSLSAGTLLLNMKFFSKAVSRLSVQRMSVETNVKGLYCDGRRIVYEPHFVLERYKKSERLPVHDYLHMLLHCIFRHWHMGADVDPVRWDAACDIAAESLIMHIGVGFCGNERIDEKAKIILPLSVDIRPLTAEKIYAYFVKNDISEETVKHYCDVFRVDDHVGWHRNTDKDQDREYEPEEMPDMIGLNEPDNTDKNEPDKNDGGDGPDDDREQQEEEQAEQEQQEEGDSPESSGSSEDKGLEDWLEQNRQAEQEQLEEQWKNISKEMQSELENFGKDPGDESRYLTQALGDVNRDKCDYAAFLRKFAVSGEIMRPDTDSFDVNFYTYGLSLYGNVALIEPPEYRETKLVRDFVIAIDTSGSVSGALVRSFVRKTYSILKSEESFFSKVNIYIIQCDTEVREAVKITCGAEFEKYMADMEIKGLGGTDFRPVFDLVDELVKKKEFSSLKGLIYFTDGFGEFPAVRPSYDTAFAFVRSDYEKNDQPPVPAWAIKLILEEEDILYGR